MRRSLSGAWAVALWALMPLSAAAQSMEVAWRPAAPPPPLSTTRPPLFGPGEALPALDFAGPRPFRPSLEVFDSPEDVAHRRIELDKCLLLSTVRPRTALDRIAGAPSDVIDWLAMAVTPAPDRDGVFSMRDGDDRSLLPRLLAVSPEGPSPHPFDDLVNQLLVREQKYFARFQDSDLSTMAVEEGTEDLDSDEMLDDQKKIWFDAARKLYFGRLGRGVDDRIREEAFDVGRWRPADFAVAPALVAGYLYVRGWEKKIDFAGLRCGLQIEPLKRILERLEGSHEDLVSAASLEVGVSTFPVKAIISVGFQDGDALIDFVGIGTSIGKAKQVVAQELE